MKRQAGDISGPMRSLNYDMLNKALASAVGRSVKTPLKQANPMMTIAGSIIESVIAVVLLCSLLSPLLAGEPNTDTKRIVSPGNTTYHIDPVRGNDSNPPGKPWRSFAKLNTVQLAPGDTVEVAPGRHEGTLRPIGAGTAERPITIRFAPGVHTIGMEGIVRLPMFVSNSCDSPDPKPIGILVQNVKHLKMEGGGVEGAGKTTILYDDRMVQIFNDRSEDITFTGLVFDLKRPTVSEFRAIEVGPTHAVVQVAEGSSYSVENGKFAWTGDLGTGRSLCQDAIPEEGRCRRARAPRGWDAQGQQEATASDIGERKVRLDYQAGASGLTAGHQYQFRLTGRDMVGIHNARSARITFRDCDVYALSGMGFVSQFTDTITIQRVNVAPPANTLRICAAWGDIFQFSNCKGAILVEGCRLSGMQDDAINCHGTYLRILKKTRDNQLLMGFMHNQTYGFAAFAPGDEIAVINNLNLREYPDNPRRKVTAVKRQSDREWLVTLDGPIPRFEKDDVLDNITWYPDLTARGNCVSMDPVRGFLLSTRGKVVVEDNTFYRCHMAGILIGDDASSWFESGPVRDMVIRKNKFIECGISISPHCKILKPGEPVHENIRIVDNSFDGGGIQAQGVGRLTITGNKSTGGPLKVSMDASCSDVTIGKGQ